MRLSTIVLVLQRTQNLCISAKGEAFPETLNNFKIKTTIRRKKNLFALGKTAEVTAQACQCCCPGERLDSKIAV